MASPLESAPGTLVAILLCLLPSWLECWSPEWGQGLLSGDRGSWVSQGLLGRAESPGPKQTCGRI